MGKPTLSVCLITYNHEKYVAQAIESILEQVTNFEWELVIADDCSTDKTREIILEYKAKHPNKISLIFQEPNVGGAKNFLDLISFPKSKYIAYLEGDDYWNDKSKLQKQVDFLETHLDYVLCYHDATGVDDKEEVVYESKIKVLGGAPLNDLTQENLLLCEYLIPTQSICFRNQTFSFPKEYFEVKNGDIYLFSFLSKFGKGMILGDIKNSVYRIHDGGVYSKESDFNKTVFAINSRMKILESLISDDLMKIKMKQNISGIEVYFGYLCLRNLDLKTYFGFLKCLKINSPINLIFKSQLYFMKSIFNFGYKSLQKLLSLF